MAKLLRYLRIAFSASCGIVAVLLIVLWVRSYSHWDGLANKGLISSESWNGRLSIWLRPEAYGVDWLSNSTSDHLAELALPPKSVPVQPYFRLGVARGYPVVVFHHLFAIVLSAALGIVPWFHWRFSLRALLIVTTLVALMLGLIVWAAH